MFLSCYCKQNIIRITKTQDSLQIQMYENFVICRQCLGIFEDRKQLSLHQVEVSHSKPKPKRKKHNNHPSFYPCNQCHKWYKSLGALNLHKKAHTKPYKCNYEDCGKSFSRNNDLKVHQMRVHKRGHVHAINASETQKVCTFCDGAFASTSSLSRHMASVHRGKEKEYVCKKCHKHFSTKHQLQSHFDVHLSRHIRKLFNCNMCGKQFTTKSNRNKHYNKFHSDQM
eukprot:483678_1